MILDGRRKARRARAPSCSGSSGSRTGRPPAGAAVGRRAAAGRDRGRARQRAGGRCSPTSRPASSTAATSREVFALLRRRQRASSGRRSSIVTHDPLVSEQVQRTVAIRDGRTAPRRSAGPSMADDGDHRVISEEFAVLDRAGRLQLPKPHIEALELQDRVRLRLEDDHVEVWPDAGRAGDGSDADQPRRRVGAMSAPSAAEAAATPRSVAPIVEARRPRPRLPVGRPRRPRPARRSTSRSAAASCRRPRPVGQRQDDAPQPPRRPRPADVRAASSSTATRSRR